MNETITWISVDDRLPDGNSFYGPGLIRPLLARDKDGRVWQVTYCTDDPTGDHRPWHAPLFRIKDVTHWAEMPKGPGA